MYNNCTIPNTLKKNPTKKDGNIQNVLFCMNCIEESSDWPTNSLLLTETANNF